MLKFALFILVFGAVMLLNVSLIPPLLGKLRQLQSRKVNKTEKQLDSLFIQVNRNRLIFFHTLIPFVLGIVVLFLFNNVFIAFISGAVGFILPTIYIKILEMQRKRNFLNQLVDALMIISSSLKGGLSLIQAIEVLSEEMSAPISQEFGVILRENKMGVTLDESLMHLYQRMKVEELELVINSLLVARETGGDLTKVFSQISTTIRDNRKLKDSIKTLTMQGRLQGIIMSVLPIIFISIILSFNSHHFDSMFQSEVGRMLIILAAVLQIVGIILIQRFSTIRI